MNILFKIFGGSYDDLWKAIIRPNKDTYKIEELGILESNIYTKIMKESNTPATDGTIYFNDSFVVHYYLLVL